MEYGFLVHVLDHSASRRPSGVTAFADALGSGLAAFSGPLADTLRSFDGGGWEAVSHHLEVFEDRVVVTVMIRRPTMTN